MNLSDSAGIGTTAGSAYVCADCVMQMGASPTFAALLAVLVGPLVRMAVEGLVAAALKRWRAKGPATTDIAP